MEPIIHVNFLAIIIAVVANFVFGFIWYTPLFGKAWAKELGITLEPGQKPPAGPLIKGMIMNLIGNFFLAFVFYHNIAVWNPITWAQPADGGLAWQYALTASGFTWLGFYLPVDLNTVAWEGKSWKFFFINTSYHLLSLILVAMILTHMMF
ncbi:hypothetical protein CNR22_22535 [Sphingobacteriaceae bacterium]|nr:hypothetical protein CNR22_22535 [Sphingobacteriaceae bacterium]